MPDLVLPSHCVRVCFHLNSQSHPDQSSQIIWQTPFAGKPPSPLQSLFVADLSDNLVERATQCIDKGRHLVELCNAVVLMEKSAVQRLCDGRSPTARIVFKYAEIAM
jgi:hypothetical protein